MAFCQRFHVDCINSNEYLHRIICAIQAKCQRFQVDCITSNEYLHCIICAIQAMCSGVI